MIKLIENTNESFVDEFRKRFTNEYVSPVFIKIKDESEILEWISKEDVIDCIETYYVFVEDWYESSWSKYTGEYNDSIKEEYFNCDEAYSWVSSYFEDEYTRNYDENDFIEYLRTNLG